MYYRGLHLARNSESRNSVVTQSAQSAAPYWEVAMTASHML